MDIPSQVPQYHVAAVLDYPPETLTTLPGIMVPQKAYTPPRLTVQPNAVSLGPIQFFRPGGAPGVRLLDVLHGQNLQHFVRDAKAVPLVSVTGMRVTIRICWPGYDDWRKENAVRVVDEGQNPNIQTLGQIAHQVAQAVQLFYTDMREEFSNEGGWGLKMRPFDKLYLIELRQVLQASWQPVFCIDI